MKSKPFSSQIRDTKFGHSAPSFRCLVDIDIAHIRELPGLHVQVAIGQTGSLFHLGKGNREPWNERGQDTEATGGAYHLVELKLHKVIYFVLQSICPKMTPVKLT
jgi:hypothetical protein